MKTKLMICASTLVIGSAIFCMEGEEQRNKENLELLQSLEKDSKHGDGSFNAQEVRSRLQDLTKEDKKRIDEEELLKSSCLDLKSAEAALKKFTDELGAKIHNSLPPKIKMVADKAAEHPRATTAIAFAAAEGCSWWCCPGFAYAANLFLGGYAARVAQTEITKKQSDILKKNK